MRRRLRIRLEWIFLYCSLVIIEAINLSDLEVVRNYLLKEKRVHKCNLSNQFEALDYEPVLYCNNPLLLSGFGNHGGMYFESIACADLIRAHFINIGHVEDDEFLISLPRVIVHGDPNIDSFHFLNRSYHMQCEMDQHPWKFGGAWEDRPSYLKRLVRNALFKVYPNASNHLLQVTEFEHLKLPLNHALTASFPMIPDSVILFRCIDIIQLSWDVYGFLSFSVYETLLPLRVSTIYIITEQIDYQIKFFRNSTNYGRAQHICIDLVHRLADYLALIRPAATVAIRRGNPIEGFLMLSLSKHTICAPSTFCLWSGLTNDNYVYFTPGKVCLNRNFLHEHFYWVESPQLILLSEPFRRGAGIEEMIAKLNFSEGIDSVTVRNFVSHRNPT